LNQIEILLSCHYLLSPLREDKGVELILSDKKPLVPIGKEVD
jgi:hypothetical protein